MNDISFEEVVPTDEQVRVLYDLLSDRVHGISHSSLPDINDHEKFVKENPYRFWYLVYVGDEPAGSFYISNENTIGINIVRLESLDLISEILSLVSVKHSPLPAIKSVRGGEFAVNVPPSNKFLINSLKKLGADLAQVTFILKK